MSNLTKLEALRERIEGYSWHYNEDREYHFTAHLDAHDNLEIRRNGKKVEEMPILPINLDLLMGDLVRLKKKIKEGK